MSEEQPEEQMGSDSEDQSTENAAQESIGSGSTSVGDTAEQQIVTDSAEPSAESVDAEVESLPDDEATEESRVGRFFKRALRWVVAMLIVFSLGVVAMQFVRVRPLIDERDSLNQSLSEVQATQQDLQAELDRLKGVEEENQALIETLQQTEVKLALLNILVDVTRAQLALAQEDPVRVAAALQGTGEKITTLRDLMQDSDLEGIRERLVLVLSEVDGDPFAAERDLEILANTLLEIERDLFGE